MERSVRRSDLESFASSTSSPAPVDIQRLKYGDDLEYVHTAQQEEREDDADELSFRLFASTKAAAPQTVRIRSPTPTLKEAGFVRPSRNSSYYFTSSTESRASEAAVSIEGLQTLASIKWTGSACPWKVLQLPTSAHSKSARTSTLWTNILPKESHRRTRSSKKTRIKLRIKLAATRQKAIDDKVFQESKDAKEREKKTRKNREKQAKKRAREKAKQAGDTQEGLNNEDREGAAD